MFWARQGGCLLGTQWRIHCQVGLLQQTREEAALGPTPYKIPMHTLSLLILEQASVELTHYKRELVQGHS